MLSRPVKLAVSAALLFGSSMALAIPFGSFDPRSMAMGGAGVAVGDASTAPLFNPALLSMTREDDHFALVLPTFGIRIADPNKLRDSIDKFQAGNYINNFQAAIDKLNLDITNNNVAAITADATAVGNNISLISGQFAALSDKPITVDGGAAVVIAVPNDKFGSAFYATGSVATGGLFRYTDGPTLTALATNATNCTSANPLSAACTSLKSFNTNTLSSGINFRGVMLSEIGFAVSTYNLGYMSWGITPKVMQAQLFDVPIKVNDSNQNGISGNDYVANYSMPNLDIGIASYDNVGWRTGMVIKNIIPYTLDFKRAPVAGATPIATGQTLTLKPMARVGVSHTTSWSTVALDYDVTSNDPAGFESSSQYLALGGEINAFDWVQLRAGYRMDLANSARNVTSIGLGLSPFGVPHFDIAVAGNDSEIGASLQFGVHF